MKSMKLWDGYLQHKREMFVGEQGTLIKQADIEKYLAENGPEKAAGYLEALNDFTAQMEVILGGGYCRNGVPNSGPRVRKYLGELVDHNKSFLRDNQHKKPKI